MAQEDHAAARTLAKTARQFPARLFHSHEESGCITCLEVAGMLFAVDLVWAITSQGHTLPGFRGHLPPWVPALGGDCSQPSCSGFSYEEPMGRGVRNRDWFVSKRFVSFLYENFHIFEKNKLCSHSLFQIYTRFYCFRRSLHFKKFSTLKLT